MIQMYGFPRNHQTGDEMIELTDLSVTATPETLRILAAFLDSMATEIESGLLRNSHIHIAMRFPEWKSIGNGIDVQVINTRNEEPALCSE